MTKISQYPEISTPDVDDLLIGTDVENSNATKNFTIQSVIDLVQEGVVPKYKVYTALLTQSGTSAPVATILENTLGGTLVWSYVVPGVFYGTLTGAFTLNKTTVLNNITNGNTCVTAVRSSVNDIQIQTRNFSNINENSSMNGMTIEIRVYN